MSEHTWFQENLACHCAGGLTNAERARLERHAADCPPCARLLVEARRFDDSLQALFAPEQPRLGFEDGLIRRLRAAPARRSWPRWLRPVAAAAAVVFLGVFGALLHGVMARGGPSFPGLWPLGEVQEAKANLKQDPPLGQKDKASELFVKEHAASAAKEKEGGWRYSPLVSGLVPKMSAYVTDDIADGDEYKARLEDLKRVEESFKQSTTKLSDETKLEKLLREELKPAEVPGKLAKPNSEQPGSGASQAKNGTTYYRPHTLAALVQPHAPGGPVAGLQDESAKKPLGEATTKAGDNQDKGKEPAKTPPAKTEPALPEPVPLGRKIIRTGDIEFEIESFDSAAATVTRLIAALPGAFVATTNSEKLPNGKVRGSMVVRMPPEKLDGFVLDLRKELGQTGELKSQRIGSQDVTKQYTDVESRLKAARTMEDRLLAIIKSGKGEIKDLLAAERELGIWRTKIEEMEGEIRYYNNQISLSTLTISLYEKEIRAAAAMVISARIGMRLEVDRVEEALKKAVAFVHSVKGRVLKSDLKQQAAGQFEALLHFQVAPAVADKVREHLQSLGHVAQQDLERLQQAEGGSGPAHDIKTRENDVQFQVVLYNVANIQPREAFLIELASLDVPAAFRKLRDAVLAAHGQVRKGELNEQDKLRTTAQLDFDIPSEQEKRTAIEAALAEVGDVLARSASQAPPGETATDKKLGYRLTIKNVAGLPPREKVSLGIEVKDVEVTAAALSEMVRGHKGTVAAAQMNQEQSGRVTALLLFDVPLSAKDELVRKFKGVGVVRVQQSVRNPQVPDSKLATAHLDVTLTSGLPIVPSDEGLWPQVRTSLAYSFRLLSWSLMFIILGLSVVLPWALLVYGVVKLIRRLRGKPAASTGPA